MAGSKCLLLIGLLTSFAFSRAKYWESPDPECEDVNLANGTLSKAYSRVMECEGTNETAKVLAELKKWMEMPKKLKMVEEEGKKLAEEKKKLEEEKRQCQEMLEGEKEKSHSWKVIALVFIGVACLLVLTGFGAFLYFLIIWRPKFAHFPSK